MTTIKHNSSSCHCSHCSHLPMKVLSLSDETKSQSNRPSYLMRGTLRDVMLKNHRSRLSIRWVLNGRYVYEIDRQNFVLEPGKFLIINDGQYYNSQAERGEAAESMTVSFDSSVLTNVINALTQKEEWLLDNPFEQKKEGEISFLTNTYPIEGEIQQRLSQIIRESRNNVGTTALDESFYGLMKQVLTDQRKISREVSKIAGAKKSTREELYRRISRARDYIRANSNQELKIETIAAQANMSPYHFLRTYKQAFEITPHQELLSIRLAKAYRLLSTQKHKFSLARIALDAGFNDLSSFSKAFKQQFGIAPSQFNLPRSR